MQILVIFVLIDLLTTGLAYLGQRGDPPYLPDFARLPDRPVGEFEGLTDLLAFESSPEGSEIVTTHDGGVRRVISGRAVFDPDASAIAALEGIEAPRGGGDENGKAERVLGDMVRHMQGGYLPHENPPTSEAPGLPEGWVSAKTQGLALSAMCRAYQVTGHRRWLHAADRIFETFLRIRDVADESGVKPAVWNGFIDPLEFLWFEQYPQGAKPSQLLTGHIWATLGLADYAHIARGGARTAARELFAGGAATASYYAEVVRRPYIAARVSPATEERSLSEHRLITAQASALGTITGDPRFARIVRHYLADSALAEFAVTDVRLHRGKDVYEGLPMSVLEQATTTEDDARLLEALDNLRGQPAGAQLNGPIREAAKDVSSVLAHTEAGFVAHRSVPSSGGTSRLTDPWFSAQTQGLLLSALVRLHDVTDDARWQRGADQVFETFQRFRGYRGNADEPPQRWIAFVGDEVAYGNLWFTAFSHPLDPAELPSQQVMAQLTAIFGLYDYWNLTGSPVAERLVDGAASTIESRLPDIRVPGGPSHSDLSSEARSLAMHRAVTLQLEALSKVMSGPFGSAADRLRSDAR